MRGTGCPALQGHRDSQATINTAGSKRAKTPDAVLPCLLVYQKLRSLCMHIICVPGSRALVLR